MVRYNELIYNILEIIFCEWMLLVKHMMPGDNGKKDKIKAYANKSEKEIIKHVVFLHRL